MPRWDSMRTASRSRCRPTSSAMSGLIRSIRGPAGLEPVQVVSFLPGPYKIRSYRGAVRGRRHLQAADRTVSRRRAADFDLRHRTPDGSRCAGAWSRSAGDPAPQSRSRGGISVPDRIRDHLGQDRFRRMSRCGRPRPPATNNFGCGKREARRGRALCSVSASRPTPN